MSYGLSVTNDKGSVIISSEYKVMVFSERGQYRITSRHTDAVGTATVVFSTSITTTEPPQVFTRYVSGLHPSMSVYISLTGGPGNWTGFNLISAALGGRVTQNFLMDYVVCKFSNKNNPQPYGLQINDYQGNPVYSSSDRVVRYNKYAKNWTFTNGTTVIFYNSDVTVENDEFICLSSFDRGVTWYIGRSAFAGLRILEGGRQVLRMNINKLDRGSWWYQQDQPTKFVIPVCKFPIERYYNN